MYDVDLRCFPQTLHPTRTQLKRGECGGVIVMFELLMEVFLAVSGHGNGFYMLYLQYALQYSILPMLPTSETKLLQ